MFSKCTYKKRYFLEVLLNLILFFFYSSEKNPECAKLRAYRVFMPYVATCLTCLPTLRAFVPLCLWFLCCLRFFFTCLTCPHLFTYLTYCLHLFMCLHFSKCFQFFTCLMCFHFFIKCRVIHNQLQQARISKNEVEKTKDSLNKPKQLRAIWENYFWPDIRVNIFLLHLFIKKF